MIAHLKGDIIKKTEKGIIINTGNIGYFVFTTKIFLPAVMENEEVELFIHSHIKEGIFELYGFTQYEELILFQKLISVNGIGPKAGMEILSIDTNKVISAILSEDEAFICKVPGIGKKTAQRLIIDLKDKVTTEKLESTHSPESEVQTDIMDALMKLGYNRNQIRRSLSAVPKEIVKVEEVITYFLKNF